MTTSIIVTTLLALGTTTAQNEPCPTGWVQLGNSCYLFPIKDPGAITPKSKGMSWDDAAKYCEQHDATLPSPKTTAEWEFLNEQNSNNRFTWWLASWTEHDIDDENASNWSEASQDFPFADKFYTNVYTDEPLHCYKQGEPHCARFQGTFWVFVNCSSTSCGQGTYPVCVKPAADKILTTDPTPAPTPLPAPQPETDCKQELVEVNTHWIMAEWARATGYCPYLCEDKGYTFNEAKGSTMKVVNAWPSYVTACVCFKKECEVDIQGCGHQVDVARHTLIENFLLNGKCTNEGRHITIRPGQSVAFEADWVNQEKGCESCYEQLYIGLKDTALKCLWSKNAPSTERGTYRKTYSFPDAGIYEIVGRAEYGWRCSPNIKSGKRIATIRVVAPTESPTESPTEAPTDAPTPSPTESPTKKPTPVSRSLSDGTACRGSSCEKCKNKSTFWPSLKTTACGTDQCKPKGTWCDSHDFLWAVDQCSECCNGYEYIWRKLRHECK